jgi:chromosome partitioning protein
MITIAVVNEKGGVGKTTTALGVAQSLIKLKKKVLFVDLDPQINSSKTYRAKIENETTLVDLFNDEYLGKMKDEDPINAIQETELGSIIPGDGLLAKDVGRYETELSGKFILKNILDKVKDKFEFCVIDTGPSKGAYQYNALIAANLAIIPIEADIYSIDGISKVIMSFNDVKKTVNPNLKLAGVVLTKYDARYNLDKDIKKNLKEICERLNTPYFESVIRTDGNFRKAHAKHNSIIREYPSSNGAKDYISLTKELLRKEFGKV